jgi:hypothetical protein
MLGGDIEEHRELIRKLLCKKMDQDRFGAVSRRRVLTPGEK